MESKDCSGCGYFSPDFYEHKLSLFWSGHFGKQNRYSYVLNMGTPGRHKERHSISWKPLRFSSWFPTLISCSSNLPRVYIRLCKHENHFTFLHCTMVSSGVRWFFVRRWFRCFLIVDIHTSGISAPMSLFM